MTVITESKANAIAIKLLALYVKQQKAINELEQRVSTLFPDGGLFSVEVNHSYFGDNTELLDSALDCLGVPEENTNTTNDSEYFCRDGYWNELHEMIQSGVEIDLKAYIQYIRNDLKDYETERAANQLFRPKTEN